MRLHSHRSRHHAVIRGRRSACRHRLSSMGQTRCRARPAEPPPAPGFRRARGPTLTQSVSTWRRDGGEASCRSRRFLLWRRGRRWACPAPGRGPPDPGGSSSGQRSCGARCTGGSNRARGRWTADGRATHRSGTSRRHRRSCHPLTGESRAPARRRCSASGRLSALPADLAVGLAWSEDDLRPAVVSAVEVLVGVGRVAQRQLVGDDPGGLGLADVDQVA